MILQSGKIDRRISFFLHYIVFFHGHKYLEKRLKHCQQHYHVFTVVRKSEKEKKEMVEKAVNETNKKQNKIVIVIYFVLICLFTHEVLRRF